MDEQNLTPAEIQVLTGRFGSLGEALGAAMTLCAAWQSPDGGDVLNAWQMMQLAGEYDPAHPLVAPAYFRVSVEGAIGLCPGAEYLTDWLFIPSSDPAALEGLQRDIATLQAPPPAERVPAPALDRFCPNCGQPYSNDNVKFCPHCGTRRG